MRETTPSNAPDSKAFDARAAEMCGACIRLDARAADTPPHSMLRLASRRRVGRRERICGTVETFECRACHATATRYRDSACIEGWSVSRAALVPC